MIREEKERSLTRRLGSRGHNIRIATDAVFTSPETTFIGDYALINQGAWFSSFNTEIRIGNKVMFGPQIGIIAGDHNTLTIGKHMIGGEEKLSEDDLPVIAEDDVWIGLRSTILQGVTVGRGSIVAAGALVVRNVPPYAVVGDVPARVLRMCWSAEEIAEHERLLYGKGPGSES